MPTDPLSTILSEFRNYNPHPLDGAADIDEIFYLPFEVSAPIPDADSPLVLVLVQRSVLQPLDATAPSVFDLQDRLARFKADLQSQGYASRFVEMSIYNGPAHRDGRIVLSIRQLLISIRRNAYPQLRGVILVGPFPEAMLVMSNCWPQNIGADGWRDNGGPPMFNNMSILTIWPDILAERADIVLADLDGTWADLYIEETRALDAVAFQVSGLNLIPAPDGSLSSLVPGDYRFSLQAGQFYANPQTFTDCFYINDGHFTREDAPPGELIITTRGARANLEVAPALRGERYIGATADIGVSRIDASHVGVNPRIQNGLALTGADGQPQAVYSEMPLDLAETQMQRDGALERQLLIEYFDRNHAYRSGQCVDQSFSLAAICYPSMDVGGLARLEINEPKNAIELATQRPPAACAPPATDAVAHASIVDYVQWLKRPATLRGIMVHSDSEVNEYGPAADGALEREVGGRPWTWVRDGSQYTPSWNGFRWATWAVHRGIWQSRTLPANTASFYIHGGCSANSPTLGRVRPYNDPQYAQWQIAESILFFLNGLAVVARAKIYYDFPATLCAALGRGRTLGDAWRDFCNERTPDKHTYDWSVLGDWTLPLRPDQGWSGVRDLGGVLSTSPAACAWAADRLDVFYAGQNSHLFHKAWMNTFWSEEQDLGCLLSSSPAVCAWAANRLDMFYRGQNRHLFHKAWQGADWSEEQDLGGILTSAPAVCSWAENRLDMFYRGLNGHLFHKAWEGTGWSEEQDLGGTLTSAPAACSWGENRIDVFYRGESSHLMHKAWQGAGWSEEQDLGGMLAAAPSVCTARPDHLEVFYTGQADDRIYRLVWMGDHWSKTQCLSATAAHGSIDSAVEVPSGIAACSWGGTRVDLFWAGSTNHLTHMALNNS